MLLDRNSNSQNRVVTLRAAPLASSSSLSSVGGPGSVRKRRLAVVKLEVSSMLMFPSCKARATSAAFVGAGRPTAAYLVRTRPR